MSININSVFALLQDILDLPEELSDNNYYKHICTPLRKAYQQGKFPYEYSIDIGASKICLSIEGLYEVIKIPFTYNDDVSSIFIGAISPTTKSAWDYCALECEYYQEALKSNLEQYFCAEKLLGYINNYPVYCQERAIPYYDCVDEDNLDTMKLTSTKKRCKELNTRCFCAAWIADFIELYGEEEFIRLTEFLNHFSITDIRAANIGYLDGAPILFDYSGYNE